MIARAGQLGVTVLLFVVISLQPREARAGVGPLRHALENATQGPLDVVLTPVVAGLTTYRNVSEDSTSVGGAVGTGFMVYIGLLMYDGSASFFRTLAGLLEIPLGVGALAATPFTDWQPDLFFDQDKPPAMVDHPTSWFHVKFGIYHVGVTE